MREATWTKGKRTIKGRYNYNQASDTFTIEVDIKDTLTGEDCRHFTVYEDTPEWYGWKLKKRCSGSSDG